MPTPKIIHQVHFGVRPPRQIRQWMDGVKAKHPTWEYHLWTEKNIGELGLEYEPLIFECQNFASLSNIVRLHAIFKFGGYYLDSDVACLKPLDPLLNHRATACFQDDQQRICNAIFSAEAGHQWIGWQIDRQDGLKDGDAAKGVYLMTEAPREGVTILPQETYYPFSWENPPKDRTPSSASYTDHFWSGSWSKKA